MSRIFDVVLDKSSTHFVQSVCGNERFMIRFHGVAGPNQIILPSYANPQEQETIIWSPGVTARKVDSDLDTIARTSSDKEVLAHVIGYSSPGLQVVKSNLKQYIEGNSNYSVGQQILQLSPQHFIPSNKATYYLKLLAKASRTDYVEVSLGSGITLHLNGEFDYYCRDKTALSLIARMPTRAVFRVSYAQILPMKDTILKLLTRSQYGQSSLQH